MQKLILAKYFGHNSNVFEAWQILVSTILASQGFGGHTAFSQLLSQMCAIDV